MNDERPNAVALVAGWIGLLAVMAFHPTGQALLLPGRAEPAGRLAIAVHGLALLCAPVVVFGALGLTRRLRAPDGLALLALLSFVAAQVAGGVAAVFGGLVAPAVARHLATASPGGSEAWTILFRYTGEVNRAFAAVLVGGSAFAVVLWSAATLRRAIGARALGVAGVLLGTAQLLALASGHLSLGVHGMGLVVLTHALWFFGAARLLWRAGR